MDKKFWYTVAASLVAIVAGNAIFYRYVKPKLDVSMLAEMQRQQQLPPQA